MKKNVICLVIDSMGIDFLEMMPNKEDLFLYKIMKNNEVYINVFAQGPYTEAAVMGLQCGQRILDYNGYFNRLADTPRTVFESFKNQGYLTFSNTIQPHMHHKSLIRGITDFAFNVAPDFYALETYRLNYYRDFFDSEKKEFDGSVIFEKVLKLFDDYFDIAIAFENSIIKNEFATSLIYKNYDFAQIKDNLVFLTKEKIKYEINKKSYIIDYYLSRPKTHQLYINPVPRQDIKNRNKITKKRVERELDKVLITEKKKYRKCNKKNKVDLNGLLLYFKKWIRRPSSSNLKSLIKAIYYNYAGKHFVDYKLWKDGGFDGFKNAPSLKSHLDHFIKWRSTVNNNYFAYIHVDDIHANSSWISYDVDDYDYIKKEIDEAYKFLSLLNNDNSGNINFLTALNHINKKIEEFYDYLVESGEINNTTLVITADHGYSIFQKPIRSNPINSFHPECYRVPVFIISNENNKLLCTDFKQTYSIPNTLLRCAGLESDSNFFGKDIKEDHIDYVIQEFMGSGCPDMSTKPLLICCRNNNLSISIKKTIKDDELTFKDIFEIYNLRNDIYEQHNIVFDADIRKTNDFKVLFDVAKERYNEIKNNWFYE